MKCPGGCCGGQQRQLTEPLLHIMDLSSHRRILLDEAPVIGQVRDTVGFRRCMYVTPPNKAVYFRGLQGLRLVLARSRIWLAREDRCGVATACLPFLTGLAVHWSASLQHAIYLEKMGCLA